MSKGVYGKEQVGSRETCQTDYKKCWSGAQGLKLDHLENHSLEGMEVN